MNKKTKRFLQAVKQSGFSYNDIRRASLEILAEEDNTDEVRELIARGDPEELFDYLKNVEDRDDVRQALIDTGDAKNLFNYLYYVEDRDDIRNALINTGDIEYFYEYLNEIDYSNEEIRQALIEIDGEVFERDPRYSYQQIR